MRKKSLKNKHRIDAIWKKTQNCHWCGISTTRSESGHYKLKHNTATFDHVYHKSDPRRKTRKGKHLGVLACYSCNQKRGREDYIKSLPAWNRFFLKHKLRIPVWKIKKRLLQINRILAKIGKNLRWCKRYLTHLLKK